MSQVWYYPSSKVYETSWFHQNLFLKVVVNREVVDPQVEEEEEDEPDVEQQPTTRNTVTRGIVEIVQLYTKSFNRGLMGIFFKWWPLIL